MTSEYDDIYSRFLAKITDYKFLQLNENDAYEMMNSWLRSAASEPEIRLKFSKIIFDDDVMTVSYELAKSIENRYDQSFVEEMFARAMVIQWLEPQVKSIANTHQLFGTKEQKFYSQSPHLSQLQNLLKTEREELRKFTRDQSYTKFLLNGV